MKQIISFIRKFKYFFLFLFLQFFAFYLIGQKNYYHRNKFLHSSNALTGFVAEKATHFDNYFKLDSLNNELLLENSKLKEELLRYKRNNDVSIKKTNYTFIPAEVIINNYLKQNNYITINVGKNNGVSKDMAVVSPRGIIGIVIDVSANYAQVLTVLHHDFKVNAALKKNKRFGTLQWDGKAYTHMQLLDIPRLSNVVSGDTIVTGGNSVLFPKDMPIGIVDKININLGDNYYDITVKLFEDMSTVSFVYVINNADQSQIEVLLNRTK